MNTLGIASRSTLVEYKTYPVGKGTLEPLLLRSSASQALLLEAGPLGPCLGLMLEKSRARMQDKLQCPPRAMLGSRGT